MWSSCVDWNYWALHSNAAQSFMVSLTVFINFSGPQVMNSVKLQIWKKTMQRKKCVLNLSNQAAQLTRFVTPFWLLCFELFNISWQVCDEFCSWQWSSFVLNLLMEEWCIQLVEWGSENGLVLIAWMHVSLLFIMVIKNFRRWMGPSWSSCMSRRNWTLHEVAV